MSKITVLLLMFKLLTSKNRSQYRINYPGEKMDNNRPPLTGFNKTNDYRLLTGSSCGTPSALPWFPASRRYPPNFKP